MRLTVSKNESVTIRDYEPGDKNFIYSTFLIGLYYGDSWFTMIEKDTFMHHYHKILTGILESPNNKIKVACLKDDRDVILGYSILSADNEAVHYVFCKSAWRSIGIAKMLVPNTVHTATHLTKAGLGLLRKYPQIKFNPFFS